MRIALPCLFALAAAIWTAAAQDAPEPVDVGRVLRESKEFKSKLERFHITYAEGLVTAVGQIVYRGGGPCEYLVNVFPTKAHETIVLLDEGPRPEGEQRRREYVRGLATTLNNAFLAAGFEKGKPFGWDRETGEVFPPKGESVRIYAEWQDAAGKTRRARMCDWLWNYKLLEVMQPAKFVYTGSQMIDEGPPNHKLWFGAEVDGLLVAVLNTSTAMIDNAEEGGLENGAYEAIHHRIPEIGTRVKVLFSKKPLEYTEKYPELEVPKEVEEERARRRKEKEKRTGPETGEPAGSPPEEADGK